MGEGGRRVGRLWTSSAPCPPCLARAGALQGQALCCWLPPQGLARDPGDSREQEGSKPVVRTELQLAQGLHLIPSTPAL